MNEPIKFYRIERNGEGVYKANKLSAEHRKLLRELNDSDRHPLPCYDSGLLESAGHLFGERDIDWDMRQWIGYSFIFGFTSVSQLRAWFYRDSQLATLDSCGYVLNIYSGEVYAGHTQAVINRDTAVHLETLSLLTLIS